MTGLTVSATTDTNATTIVTGEDLFFAASGGLTAETTADGTVTHSLDVNGLSAAAIASGDQIAFSDENVSGDPTKKESVDDIATLFAGTGLTATSAVIAVDAAQTQITSVGTLSALTVTGAIDLNATTLDIDASDDIDIDTSDTTGGIAIGTANSGVPITIGHGTSEVSFGDNVTIAGTLTVSGGTTTISSTILTVDDKNIELGSVDTPTDTTADGGGITLKGASDKTITWDNANDNWTSNQDWNIASGTVFRVNNVEVLTGSTLGSAITTASGLVSVSTLGTGAISSGFGAIDNGASSITTTGTITGGLLNVDNLRLDANTLSSTNTDGNITLTPNGTGVVSIATGNLTYASTNVTSTGAELNLLDGSSAGSVVNSKAVIYSAAGQVNASQLSVDAVAIVDTGTSGSSQTVANGATEDVFSYAYGTYRTAKFVYQVSDGTDFESGELLINYKGASAPTNTAAIFLNQYGIVSTKASNASLVSWDVVKDGTDITIQFTNGTGGSVDYDYSIVNTQLIK